MNRGHLGDDELIGLVYGLGEPGGHVSGCTECTARLHAMRKIRAEMAAIPEIDGHALVAQRQQILDRLERPALGWRWIPAAGIAALIAVVLILARPSNVPLPVPAVNTEADSELFTDVYSMERDVEPRAAAPIRSLFQAASFEQEVQ